MPKHAAIKQQETLPNRHLLLHYSLKKEIGENSEQFRS